MQDVARADAFAADLLRELDQVSTSKTQNQEPGSKAGPGGKSNKSKGKKK